MDRPIVYPGALPRAADFLSLAQNAMVAVAKLSETTLGTSAIVDGFALTPTSPASLSAVLGPGSIYEQEDLEASPYSTLPANTTSLIVKQGIALGPQTLTFAPPTTLGYAQCFLVEASYQDSDTGSLVLPYYNAANPTVPYSGPGNAGTANNTVRQGAVAVQVKAGIAAPTGTQVVPTPDAGFSGMFVVTLAYGATSVTAGNIARYSAAPFLYAKLGQIPAAAQNDQFSGVVDTGAQNAVVVNPVPPLTQYQPFQRLRVKMAFAPTGAASINVSSIGQVPIVHQGGAALSGGEWAAGDYVELACTGVSWQLVGAAATLPPTSFWHVGIDTSTDASTVTATVSPAVPTRIADLAYLIFPVNACAGVTQINVGFGLESLRRNDGTPLQAGDYAAGQPLAVIDDGTLFRIVDLTPSQVIALIIANQQKIVAGAPSLSPPQNLTAYTTQGTYTFTVPANITFVDYLVVGAGGGGHGAGTSSLTWSGAGGGAGGSAQGRMAVTPGQTISVVVGAGGAGNGPTAVGQNAGSGGTSSFGSSVFATGGGGGNGGPSISAGGTPGQGSGGQLNTFGAVGGEGCPFQANIQGGGGGASILGGGGRTSLYYNVAVNGQAPGSGGGGIYGQSAGSNTSGGNGADGAVIIQY